MQLHDGVKEERSDPPRLQEWDEGFKQGIKKEGRIGARSLDGFKSLRSWKYVSSPLP